jgi:putative ATP-binding cassette transporter
VFVTKVVSQVSLIHLSQNAFLELRMHLSKQILKTPLRHLEEIGPSRLLATLTDDVASITNSVLGIPYLCINGAIVLGCLGYLVILSPPVFLTVIISLVLGVFSYQLPLKRAIRYFDLAREDQDGMFGHFRALTMGIKELKLHLGRQAGFLSGDLQANASAYRKHESTGMAIYSIAGSWGQLLFFVLIGIVLFALPLILEIEQATLTGYILIVLYMMSPIEVIMGWMPHIGRASVALRKVESLGLLLTESEQEATLVGASSSGLAWRQIECVNATHTYYREQDGGKFTLGPINLSLQPGEVVFLIGGNGSGKTTLAKLLSGLYTPESGEILVNGAPVTDENRVWYRQHFTVVFSDFFLFNKLSEFDENHQHDAQAYLQQFQLDHKVTINNGVFSTTDLSQGQRKRLALLTAFLEDRPVYIFDEWAADQDPFFKEIFYTQLLPDLRERGKAVLVISHDDRYFHLADRMIKLDYGKVALMPDGYQTI